jgi:sterol desaturase/sphingolipid hydroxylase (fatty acid hydroxylase superfamily)
MNMHWLRTDGAIFWAVFTAAFLSVAIWESVRPWRELSEPPERRWGRHALLYVVSIVISAVLIPANPVLLAAALRHSHYGLLNHGWPGAVPSWILTILVLDFLKFAIHRAMHSYHWLWRVHQVHHSDRDFDVSTSVRAHPLEVILSHVTTLALVLILAPPAGAVLLAQLASIAESFFSHANASLPGWLQKILGTVFYTSDTHRIHHATDPRMQNTNFGDIFPWWDQMFRTYTPPLPGDAKELVIGLAEFQQGDRLSIPFLLKQPFLPEERKVSAEVR